MESQKTNYYQGLGRVNQLFFGLIFLLRRDFKKFITLFKMSIFMEWELEKGLVDLYLHSGRSQRRID